MPNSPAKLQEGSSLLYEMFLKQRQLSDSLKFPIHSHHTTAMTNDKTQYVSISC